MDVETLRWFQLVADGTTVTEVAELFQVSQPGVSRALARLEKDVGSPLLLRRGRMLRATHAGTVFKRHVDAALHDLDDGLAAVNELIDPETGTVSVAFQLSLGAWLVPDLIDTFRRDHARVRFRLTSSDDARGSMVLADGQLDLELTARRPTEEGVGWEHLFTQPLVLAVPLDHPLANLTEVRLDRGRRRGLRHAPTVLGAACPDRQVVSRGRLRASLGVRVRRPGRRPRLRRRRARGGDRPGGRIRARGRRTVANGTCGSWTRARTARSAWPGRRNADCCPRPSCSVAT